MAEYWAPGEAPVCGKHGRLSFAGLRISDSLRQALIDWQAEAYPPDGWSSEIHERSEDEWRRDGEHLAERLAAETGLRVEFVD